MKIIIVIIVCYIIYRLIKEHNAKSKSGGSNARYSPGTKLCYDCKHCDSTRHGKDGQIYCKWDSEYYYPAAAGSCGDFARFSAE